MHDMAYHLNAPPHFIYKECLATQKYSCHGNIAVGDLEGQCLYTLLSVSQVVHSESWLGRVAVYFG